ncbi:MAG: bacillithiol biosynthesis deacetylase BshB1 [Bacteroidetes bacterium]|nr:bacillithiol biosynthesis deacetylase BshB1 [Bacteroidota bacterium]
MRDYKVDILALGVHPDDIELSCAGTLLSEQRRGKRTAIVDLTRGELGTRGSAETRILEAEDAAKVLKVSYRENLQMRDGFFKNDEESQMKIIRVLRKYRPEIVLCNAPSDRHPDHGRAAELVRVSAFLSGLQKIETDYEGKNQEAWRPAYVFNYIQDQYLEPNFVVDISDVIEEKIEAIKCYKSQFFNKDYKSGEPQTYISSPQFLNNVISRSEEFGKQIGVKSAEGYISAKIVGINNFDLLVKHTT